MSDDAEQQHALGSRAPNRRPFVLLAAIGVVGALWIGTATAAARFGYSPRLGAPLYGAHVYAPWALLRWSWAVQRMALAPDVAHVYRVAWLTTAFLSACWLGIVGVLLNATPATRAPLDSHGTARWGDGAELRRARGFIVGAAIDA